MKALDYDVMVGGIKYIIPDSKELVTASVVRKAMLALADRVIMTSKPLVKEQDRRNHWHCPDCEFVMGMEAKIYNYCPKCGLPIRMEEE